MVLIFIAHIEGIVIHLYIKKKKESKKKFFASGKGGGPLKGTPPLSGVSKKRQSENS